MSIRIMPPTAAALALAGIAAGIRQPRPVRPIGPIERVSSEPLMTVAQAVRMPGGRVMINDRLGGRVLLFDSTLSTFTVVADTTSATGGAYGRPRPGSRLLRYHGDSALLVDPSQLSMLVLTPQGTIARVMAIPRPEHAPPMLGVNGTPGTPGFDAHGRLVYMLPRLKLDRSATPTGTPDSGVVVRVDPATRTVDTVGAMKIMAFDVVTGTDSLGPYLRRTDNPLQMIDALTVTADGSIAIVRGRDYHVDWLGPDGQWTVSLPLPFEWQRLTDADKVAIIDSTVAQTREQQDVQRARVAQAAASGRGGRGGAVQLPRFIADRVALSRLPDARPPFLPGEVLFADLDNNIWIKTSALVKGAPVYDVVNRRGQLIDRVLLPPFRTIAGFGPGVVYMAVIDSAQVVHLERARLRQAP